MDFQREGQGPAVVLLPGLGCDERLWQPVGERLRSRFTVIHPRTWGGTSLPEAAAELAALLDQAAGGRAAVAGLSMGGYLAFELLRQTPEKIWAAALVDTTAFPDDEARAAKRRQVLRLIRDGRFPEVLRAFAESVLADGRSAGSATFDLVLAMGQAVGAEAFAAGVGAILRRGEYADVLRLLRVPTLFLCGEADALTPPEAARRMAAEVPGARVRIVPGAGHLTPLEKPEETAKILESFLTDALGSAA